MKRRIRFAAVLSAILAATAGLSPAQAQQVDEAAGSTSEVEFLQASAGGDEVDSGCYDCCDVTWTFQGEALFMQRARPDSLVLMQDVNAPGRNLNADAFRFDFEPGWAVAARRQCGCNAIEARFFSIDGWDAGTTAIAGPPSDVQINNTPVTFVLPSVTAVNASYHSELLSFELNLRRRMNDCVEVLGGFRYFELDEHLRAVADAGAAPTTYDVLTANRLYGGQGGIEGRLWCNDRLTVDGLAKLGVYYADGSQFTVIDTGGAPPFTAADTSERAAFVADLGLTGTYCLTDCLSLRAGYNIMWIETVVLASDQIPATDFVTGSGIAADGGAFYHGGLVGLEYRR